MSRSHGKDCRAYLGGRDISGDITSINPSFNAQTLDTTTLGDDWIEYTPGLMSWEAALEAFYDGAAGGIGRQFETLLGASGGILSIYEGDADAVGDMGILCSNSILENRNQPITVADMVKLSGALKGTGRVGFAGRLLHANTEEAITGTGTSLNNSGSSANGGRGTLHVLAITGTWTIKIQDSANDSDWADLVTFTQVAAAGGVTSETLEVTGTVDQYLRVSFTEDVAGSITPVVGFARY